MPVVIRSSHPADAPRICEVYNHYVRESIITFEELPVAEDEMAQRIATAAARLPWLVAEQDGAIAGYACATPWKLRSAYRYSVESTIYLAPEFTGRGIGSELYRALIAKLRDCDVHCVVSGISLPNPASVALHEKLGFQKIGQFREVGWKFGKWVDVGYWELIF